MFKRIFLWIAVGLSLIGCMLLNLVTSPEFMPDETSLTSTEPVRIASATASGQQTQDAYPATDAIDPILQTATQLVYEASATASQQAINATDDYWSTQGAMPAATSTPDEDPFYQTATQYIIEATASALYTPQSQRERLTNTPDNFALTATQIIIEASATHDANETPTVTVPANSQSQSRNPTTTPDAFSLTATQIVINSTTTSQIREANITATANYWATQGITPTPPPAQLTSDAINTTSTQVVATLFARGCEKVSGDYLVQFRQFNFATTPIAVSLFSHTTRTIEYFDCPDPADIPRIQSDFIIEVIFPSEDIENVNDYITQALILLPDYPFDETTFGSDNLILVANANDINMTTLYGMQFNYSELVTALDEGLEGEALLEALGGVESTLP